MDDVRPWCGSERAALAGRAPRAAHEHPRARTAVTVLLTALLAAMLVGCGDDDAPPAPADGGVVDAGGGRAVTPPAAPLLLPCAAGFSEREVEPGLMGCDPGLAPERCADAGEERFMGGAGCAPIGRSCPAGPFREDLPSDAPLVYVAAGASGGDGTRALPYGSLTDFSWGALRPGTMVVLSGDRFEGPVRVPRGVTLQGSCARDTIIAGAAPAPLGGLVEVIGSDAALRDLQLADSPRVGLWIESPSSPSVTTQGVLIQGVSMIGAHLANGGRLVARRLVVRDVRFDGVFGRGVNLQSGSQADLEDVVMRGMGSDGVVGDGAATAIAARRLVVRESTNAASGLRLTAGAAATVEASVIEGTTFLGVFADGAGTTLEAQDLVLRDNVGTGTTAGPGGGVAVQHGASAVVRRLLLERNENVGLFAAHAGTTLDASDVVALDMVERRGTGRYGTAAETQQGARLVLARATLARARSVALLAAHGGSVLEGSDVEIRDTRSRALDGAFGRGLSAQLEASVRAERVRVRGCHDTGVFASAGATAALRHLDVHDTTPATCGGVDCPSLASAFGVAAAEATVDVASFRLSMATTCGLILGPESSVDLADGEVSGNEIGVCVQADGYDIMRLSRNVAFRDNGTNLDSTTLPVPAVLDSTDGL